MKLSDWIFDYNLKPFLKALSWFICYGFNSDDWVAFEFGIKKTDAEKGHWFEYTFLGQEKAEIRVAIDSGTSVVIIEIDVSARVAPKVKAAIEIMQNFKQIEDS